jgi:hypothetical protein
MAYFSIGEEADRFLVNAVAKAFEHRDHQANPGSLLSSQQHRLSDGDFRHGHSAEVECTIVGASALSPTQDRFQAQLLAAEFNYMVDSRRGVWTSEHPGGDWFCNQDKPGERYAAALESAEKLPWVTATT